jgi:hypothetical protein
VVSECDRGRPEAVAWVRDGATENARRGCGYNATTKNPADRGG